MLLEVNLLTNPIRTQHDHHIGSLSFVRAGAAIGWALLIQTVQAGRCLFRLCRRCLFRPANCLFALLWCVWWQILLGRLPARELYQLAARLNPPELVSHPNECTISWFPCAEWHPCHVLVRVVDWMGGWTYLGWNECCLCSWCRLWTNLRATGQSQWLLSFVQSLLLACKVLKRWSITYCAR